MTNSEEYNKKYNKKYYLKNKKKLLDYGKKWRSENKEWMKEYNKKYRCENREELKRKKRIYNVNTREKRKEYYIKNREKRREYRKKNERRYLNLTHKRRAKLKITDISIEWLNKLFYKTKKCSLCKCKLDNNGKKYPNGKQIDHIIPLSVGGEHMKYNVRIVCMKCNLERPKDGSDNLQLIINFKEAI